MSELPLTPAERGGLALLRAIPVKQLLDKVLADIGAKNLERTPSTMMFNQTGQPAMNMPLHFNAQGLPADVQFAGRFGDEATLFQLAVQLEQARAVDRPQTPGVRVPRTMTPRDVAHTRTFSPFSGFP